MKKRTFSLLMCLPLTILVLLSIACALVLRNFEPPQDTDAATRSVPTQYQVLDEATGEPSTYALNITNAGVIGLDVVDDWLSKRTEGEGFQWLMYTDPDSWDALIYIPEIGQIGDFTNGDVTMEIAEGDMGRTLNVYLHTEAVVTHEKTPEEQILHFAAPMRGVWPNRVKVYVDGVEQPCDDMQIYE